MDWFLIYSLGFITCNYTAAFCLVIMKMTDAKRVAILGRLGAKGKQRTEGKMKGQSVQMKREMGLMYERMLFSRRKRESHGCRLWHCPSFTTVPVSPVALQHISTQLINASVTTISSPFEDYGEKKKINSDDPYRNFLFDAAPSFYA